MDYYKDENGYPKSVAFSISRQEMEQIKKEYDYANILNELYEAAYLLGNNITIGDAIEKISERTRFAKEIKEQRIKNITIS